MSDKELIQRVRILKAMKYIQNYYEIAEQLEITGKAFYNWMGGYYNLGYKNKQKLDKILKEYNL